MRTFETIVSFNMKIRKHSSEANSNEKLTNLLYTKQALHI